jgi:hypothetical protein
MRFWIGFQERQCIGTLDTARRIRRGRLTLAECEITTHDLPLSVGLPMNIHLSQTREHEQEDELVALFEAHIALAKQHRLVADPHLADLVLILGRFGHTPHQVLDHPAYQAVPDRCAVYTEDDTYLPLLPGVYCSARRDQHTRAGRIFSYSYLSRHGRYRNQFIAQTASPAPAVAAPQMRYLFTFQGSASSRLRERLFKLKFDREDVLIEDTTQRYDHWQDTQPGHRDGQLAYAQAVASSHFVLCPRGAGLGTFRLFEVMAAGIAPVLLSDHYELPPGPAWDTFLVRVPEREIARLPALLEPLVASAAERGRQAREAYLEHFAVDREFDRVIELAARSLHHRGPAEAVFRRQQSTIVLRDRFQRSVRSRLGLLPRVHG